MNSGRNVPERSWRHDAPIAVTATTDSAPGTHLSPVSEPPAGRQGSRVTRDQCGEPAASGPQIPTLRNRTHGGAYQAGLASIGVTLMALYLACLVLLIGIEFNRVVGEGSASTCRPRVAR
jgi:hypothetical protein